VRSSKFANLRQVVTLPIAMIDREYQEREEHPPNRVSHFFTLSPSSTSRRMASESVGVSACFSAHLTISARITGSARKPIIGVIPVAGRPADFCLADIVFFIISV
jgi:hypothetical protein